MAHYDGLIQRANQRCGVPIGMLDGVSACEDWVRVSEVLTHLQQIVREYNPDDALFDDEKTVSA